MAKKYTVIGDITLFHGCDRWGRDPIRRITTTNWLILAYIACLAHVRAHPHGSAWVVRGERPDLRWANQH